MKIGVKPSDLAYHVFNTSHPLTLHKEELLADVVHFPKYSREAFLKDIAAHSNLKPVSGSDSFTLTPLSPARNSESSTSSQETFQLHKDQKAILEHLSLELETKLDTSVGGVDPPRLVLRQQRQEPPFPNGDNAANLPLQITYLPQPYHGQYQNMVPNSLPYATFQSQLPMTYKVPLNINMAPSHATSQIVDARNHHRNMNAHNGRGPEGDEEMYAGCTPVLEERRNEHTGRVSPRVALRTMMQQALRPSTQREKFERQTHYTQHSHYPRDAFGLSSRGVSVASDTLDLSPNDRSLEASIREQLARSGLLRDCPDPEYVNRPMAVDPSIVSCGRALKQQIPFHHHRPQYPFSQPQPSEEVKMSRELSRPPFSISTSPPKLQRNTGIPTYKVVVPRSSSPQIQTYRGVDSVIKEPKRRDNPQSYKVEAGSKFLTKDDYTPTKRIVGYFVESSGESPKSAKRYPTQSLSNHDETTPKPLRHPVKNRSGGVSEPEMTQSLIRDGKDKVNKSEETPRVTAPLTETTEGETLNEPIDIIDKYVDGPKTQAHATADLLEDCINSLATWEKGDRRVLLKLLKVLKRLDDEDDAKPIESLRLPALLNPAQEKKRNLDLITVLTPRRRVSKILVLLELILPAPTMSGEVFRYRKKLHQPQNEMLPMFYLKPLMSTEPVWIKTQQRTPMPPLDPPPSEEDEGRVAKAMDPRLAGPLLTRFYNKYPLTGTVCPNPPSPPPAAVKNAAEIQEELETPFVARKGKEGFCKFFNC
ncbi:uncharacterized protein EAF02_005338 [Botrytis sinoallii]|uniref:uncharacterized protein n=1 Tax=Botrytis sinoallii TaxID=1463999 RepID=UPI001901FB3D|nr:uncharacterized protein EAF02_005338 [Botrytis sinoallii]KAF7883418.1 hypothetical protein EAF02_005338 [Botrytis sinoallii]